uniref:Uncharacterized protein n=1 Tax=Oreochromis niloticus TaxID=8128 RepID=A0A669CW64_ORENI
FFPLVNVSYCSLIIIITHNNQYLSIILADWVMTILMAALWLLGPVHSFTPCFILTNASATYAALPLPMILLGLTDYLLGDKALSNRRAFFKTLGNVFLTLLVWLIAFTCSFSYADAKLMDMSCGKRLKKALVCEVEESKLVINFIAGIFTAILLTLLPFCSHIPQWVRDTEGDEKSYPTDTIRHRPPLWISLILGFATFWMPFLAVSLACLVFGLGVPAYISVNLLWLECTNSLLLGVLFWVKTKSPRPHTNLPENLCSWHIYCGVILTIHSNLTFIHQAIQGQLNDLLLENGQTGLQLRNDDC